MSSGARTRAIAGVICAALLAATAATTDADLAAPPGANEKVVFNDEGLPQAVDEDGKVIPASVGEPPEIKVEGPRQQIIDRAEAANSSAPPDLQVKHQPGRAEQADPTVEPDTLLVTFAPGTSDADAQAALDAAGVDGRRLGGSETFEIATADKDHAELTESLEASNGVKAVDPNRIRRATKVPNDPHTATQQQYLNGLGIQNAWDIANPGASVTVAVIDSGVDLDHPDLAPNLVAGFNTLNGGSAQDDNGHGTMVAGIIGAATNNGVGIAGIAWNAKIMPIKMLDAEGIGSDEDLVEAIYWAADHGAKVINMSLGGAGGSYAIDEAVAYALSQSIVLVGAAGNDAAPWVDYPAAAPGVIAVSATDHAGNFAWYSNHSPRVDVAAPGIDIRSTALAAGPTAAVADGTGTSFSSPIVAGVAALVRERHPSWTWDLVFNEVLRTVTDKGPAGADPSYGFGLIDAGAAVNGRAIAPVSQPSLAGDAGNLPAGAKAITAGTPTTETIGYVGDEDWFSFNVTAAGGATVTVTPPVPPASGLRAHEIDPVVEVYGPNGGLVADADDGFVGEPEQLQFNAAPGLHRIRVQSYLGSHGTATYTVGVQLGSRLPEATWAEATTELRVDAREVGTNIVDVTGDGRKDLLAVTEGGGTGADAMKLFVLAQLPDGTLDTPRRLSLQSRGSSMTTGDFDGDGTVDVAISGEAGLDVAWNGAAGLAEPVLYPLTTTVRLSAADLDDDGPVEILTIDTWENVATLRWNGDSFVSQALGFRTDNTPGTGDLNGDGRTDLVTSEGGRLVTRLQASDGSWQAPTTVAIPGFHVGLGLTVSDISGDGRADIVATGALTFSSGSPSWSDPVVATLRQRADGSLEDPILRRTLTRGSPEIGDVTGDGRADVVIHDFSSHMSSVFKQTFTGALGAERLLYTIQSNGGSPSFALGDLDGDHVDDLAIINPDDGLAVRRHQKNASSTPETTKPWVSATNPAPHATGVATTVKPSVTFGRSVDPSISYGPGGTVLLTDGRNGYWLEASASVSGNTLTVSPTYPLAPGVPYTLHLMGMRGLPSGSLPYDSFTFTTAGVAPPTYKVNANYYPFPLDMDANGYDDIVFYTPATAADPVWGFSPYGKFDIGSLAINGSFKPVAGDFDGNGYEDIFLYAPGTATDIMYYVGPPDDAGYLTITQVNSYKVNATNYTPVAGDFDGNGYEDIVFYAPGTGSDVIWKFKAGNTFTGSVTLKMDGTGYQLAAGDYNRDGYDDIFWHKAGTAAEVMWKGGPTNFASGGTAKINANYSLRAGDFNGDGFDDIYGFGGTAASLLKGNATGFTGQVGPVQPTNARPVAGDFTGDLRDDLLAYVPGTTGDKLIPGKPTGL